MKIKISGLILLILISSAYFSNQSLPSLDYHIIENDLIERNYEKINNFQKKVKVVQDQAESVNENVKKTSIEVVDKIARVKDYTTNILDSDSYPTSFINNTNPAIEAKINTLVINQNIPNKNWRLSINLDKLSSDKYTISKNSILLKNDSQINVKNILVKQGNPLIIECLCEEVIGSLKINPIVSIMNTPDIYKGVYTGNIDWNFESL